MLGHERLELADQLHVPAELELVADPRVLDGEAKLLQLRDCRLCERLVREIRERRPAEERPRLAQELHSGLGAGSSRPLQEEAGALRVDLVALDLQGIAGRLRDYPLGAEPLPQLRDGVLDRRARRSWRLGAPERFCRLVRRDDLAGANEQHGQERAILRRAHAEGNSSLDHLQRPEDPELHALVVTAACRPEQRAPRSDERAVRERLEGGRTVAAWLPTHPTSSSPPSWRLPHSSQCPWPPRRTTNSQTLGPARAPARSGCPRACPIDRSSFRSSCSTGSTLSPRRRPPHRARCPCT